MNFCVKCQKNAFILETVRDGAILLKYLTHRVYAESSATISQKSFSLHLEILRKCECENVRILKMVPDTAISTKNFDLQGIHRVICNFCQNFFPTIFVGHLEFLREMQKCIYLVNSSRLSNFHKVFEPQGMCRVTCNFLPKMVFPPFLTPY